MAGMIRNNEREIIWSAARDRTWLGASLGEIAILGFFLFIFLVCFLFLDRFQFDWIDGGHFKVGPAFGTRQDFSLVHLIFFNVQAGFTLRAVKHNSSVLCLGFYDCTLLYLVSSKAKVKSSPAGRPASDGANGWQAALAQGKSLCFVKSSSP